MNHTELLNYLIKKHDLKSYLEIGVRDTRANFDKIICDYKRGIDPEVENIDVFSMESDYYFKHNYKMYDLIFIDGLHHADQVKRDFENSLYCLNDNGFIVLHDTCPTDESTTIVPRGTQKIWHGDVYKFAMMLCTYDGINFYTLDNDCGITVIWKDKNAKGEKIESIEEKFKRIISKKVSNDILNNAIESDFIKYLCFKNALLKIVDEPA